MKHGIFVNTTTVTTAGLIGTSILSPVPGMNILSNSTSLSLLGNRFVTLCIMIRTTPWEVSRDVRLIEKDESDIHTLEVVRNLREAFTKNNPDSRLTRGFTLNALE
jgi:hypothetical protein